MGIGQRTLTVKWKIRRYKSKISCGCGLLQYWSQGDGYFKHESKSWQLGNHCLGSIRKCQSGLQHFTLLTIPSFQISPIHCSNHPAIISLHLFRIRVVPGTNPKPKIGYVDYNKLFFRTFIQVLGQFFKIDYVLCVSQTTHHSTQHSLWSWANTVKQIKIRRQS
jgi:hypothetical protein